jgi:membrane protein implicated in regulation of membrane protease activity
MEMAMSVAWWIWLVLGLMLIAGEMLMPSDFFLFFFGVGALTASVTTALGLTQGAVSQSVVFVAVSIVTLLTLRGWLRSLVHRDAPHREVDSLVGEICTTVDEIPANGIGKVILRGSPWNARNPNARAIAKTTRVRVEKVEGITLVVRELGPVDMIEDLV